MKLKENKLFVDYHEWAWSMRTQGFPIFAVSQDGKVVQIGTTTKKPKIYKLPENTVAIVRKYVSNSGIETWHIYTIPSLNEFVIGEKNNWDTSKLPENLQGIINCMVQQYLSGYDS